MRTQKQTVTIYGYARNLFGNLAAHQERALLDAGCQSVFVEGRGRETFVLLAHKARRAIIKITTAAVLPNGADRIRAAFHDLDAEGVVLIVEDTGKRSDSGLQRAGIILDALEGQKRNKNEFDSGSATSAAKKSWKRRRPQRAPEKEVLRMWRDIVNYPSTPDLLIKLSKLGWTKRMMYARFNGRFPELGLGRPRKSSKD